MSEVNEVPRRRSSPVKATEDAAPVSQMLMGLDALALSLATLEERMAATAEQLANLDDRWQVLEQRQAEVTKATGLLEACSDKITELCTIQADDSQRTVQALQAIDGALAHRQGPRPAATWRLLPWWVWGLPLVAMLVTAGLAWWWWPDTRWQPLGRKLDAALVQVWPALPKPVQDGLKGVYGDVRIVPPSERQQGAKK